MKGVSVWCLLVHEREDASPGQFICSHVGPIIFSSELLAKEYVCANILVPQLEEALFDEKERVVQRYAVAYDGRYILPAYRSNYAVLTVIWTGQLQRLRWTQRLQRCQSWKRWRVRQNDKS
jgi:hypothetical protein